MPNVDMFERNYKVLLKSIVEDDGALVDKSSNELFDLPTANKPTLFRKHSLIEIKESAENLLNQFDGIKTLEYSVNNKDLYDILVDNEHHLEIKLGAATDSAIGLASVKELTGVDFIEPGIADWREEVQSKTLSDLKNTDFLERRLRAYQDFIRESSEKIELAPVGDKANHILNNFVLGINVNSDEIAALEEVPTIILTTYTKAGWVLKPLTLSDESDWFVEDVSYNPDTNRVRVLFSNGNISIKILSNQKNSYKSKKLKENGVPKIEPLYGFGSLSFNLWVNRE